MSVLIEDSPRNLSAWIETAVQNSLAAGAVISPFATPPTARPGPGGRRGLREVAAKLQTIDAELWVDPTTHALQMAGVGDFRYYDDYDLWRGPRGDLSTPAFINEHVRLVFELQDSVGARRLGPTVLLHHGESTTSQQALDLAQAAVDRDPDCWLTIAGTAPFWASEHALDAHIGALAQLQPKGWFLTVVRPLQSLPVDADSAEVHGLCRTTRSLSEYAQIHISHGDIAALPAIAAGATSIGSGWDQRQRVCAYAGYAARDASGGGGGWYERPTLPGLCGSLTVNEANILINRDHALATRLGPLPPPGPNEAFTCHLRALRTLLAPLHTATSLEQRFNRLTQAYSLAVLEWPPVGLITDSPHSATDWIDPLAEGLRLYGVDEGWA